MSPGHLRRYRQIADVLARHGLGYLVGVFGIERAVPFHKGLLGHARQDEPYTQPQHLRLALEELGTTFIKLGQILSTRPDLLPPDFITELSRLQDSASTVPFEAVRETITAELDRPIEEVFAQLDPEPLASASIGQAHAATLADGTDVVVKVRRPGVIEQVNEDIEILHNLATAASRRWDAAREYDLVGLADEFAETLRHELDYLAEARNAERFATAFADDAEVHIPRVIGDASTSRILTLERVRGLKISDTAALDASGIDRRAVARLSTRVLCRMVFEDGFFHADPHPGNFFVEEGGRLGVIDFGMVGTLDDPTRDRLAVVLMAATTGDGVRLADGIVALGAAPDRVDRLRLGRDMNDLLARYTNRPIGEVPIGPLLEEILSIMRRHRLQLPANLALLVKTMVMSEGLGVRLDPDYRLGEVLAPYATALVARQYSPAALARKLGRAGAEALALTPELPAELRRIVDALDRQGLRFDLREESLRPVLEAVERQTRRITTAIVAAGLIVGVAVLAAALQPPPAGMRTAFYITTAAAVAVVLLLIRLMTLRA
jgi:ubiquinone biosynthesis protein